MTAINNHIQNSTEEQNQKQAPQKADFKKECKLSDIARRELIKLSQIAKVVKEQREIETGEFFSINDILLEMHRDSSGANDFRTFQDWKKAGYSVRKGEKSFRVWGKPVKAKKAVEPESDPSDSEEKSYKLWPMCSLFNEMQVEPNTPA